MVEFTTSAPSATMTRPSSEESASTLPSIRVSIFSSSKRFASSSGVSLPVSIHQPVSSSVRTRRPLVISHWIASVISSSPRADGSMARTASWIVPVEEVDADEGEVGRRVSRLLDQRDDMAGGVERRNAEAVRVGNPLEQDLRGGRRLGRPGGLEGADERGEVLLEQVVAEVHHEVVVAEEVAGDQHAVRKSERGVLGQVGDLGAELAAVAHRGPDLGPVSADDHADLGDPGGDHRLDPVEQDRLVGDGDQLLGPRVGDRAEPRAFAAGEDERLHRRHDTVAGVSPVVSAATRRHRLGRHRARAAEVGEDRLGLVLTRSSAFWSP